MAINCDLAMERHAKLCGWWSTYTRMEHLPLGVGVGKQSARSCSVSVEIKVIELKGGVIGLQSLGEFLA